MDGLGPLPDGSRRKVERVDKATAQRDLDELLTLRAQALEPPPRRQQAASFAQIFDAWLEAGCPIASPVKTSRHAARSRRTPSPTPAICSTATSARRSVGSGWTGRRPLG